MNPVSRICLFNSALQQQQRQVTVTLHRNSPLWTQPRMIHAVPLSGAHCGKFGGVPLRKFSGHLIPIEVVRLADLSACGKYRADGRGIELGDAVAL